MRTANVTGLDGLDWAVQVQWRPRFVGLVRQIGGWRDKRKDPQQGQEMAEIVLEPRGPMGGWSYQPAPRSSTGTGTGMGADAPTPGAGGSSAGRGGWFDFDDLDDAAVLVLAVLVVLGVVILGVVLFWWVLLPALLVVLDGLLIAALFTVGVFARVFLRRPWTVQAISTRGDRLTKKVVGWGNARRARDDLAAAIRNGAIPAR